MMDADKVLEHLLKELQKEADIKGQLVANGAVHTFDEYKYVCGQIRGLLLAKDVVNSLLQNVMEIDE